MKKFYYVILSMIAIALVSCTSELDEINNTVHQQETLSGNELGANLMKSFQNAVSRVMLYLLQDLLPQDTLYKKLELMYTKMNR